MKITEENTKTHDKGKRREIWFFWEKSEGGGGCNQLNQTLFKHQLDEPWVIRIGFRDMDVIGSSDDYGYVEVAEFKTQL